MVVVIVRMMAKIIIDFATIGKEVNIEDNMDLFEKMVSMMNVKEENNEQCY